MIQIDKIIPGGQALGTADDGKKFFFWNALPGEVVTEYRITKNKSNFTEATALSVANPSMHRVEPKDACFLSTSPWQNIDYAYELELKQQLVAEIFREHQIAIDSPTIYTDNRPYFYRNKMEYTLYWDKNENQIRLAFHERGSHRKMPINNSSIERPEIFATAARIVTELNERHEEARKYQSLLLRCNQQGVVSGGLFENRQPHPRFAKLSDVILSHQYSYSPNGFFQINLPVYEMALSTIKQHIHTRRVLDLYAGVGTIGLSVARDRELTSVECDKFAFDELSRNAAGLNNVTTILDKSENVTNYLAPDQTVILDPPRAGCDRHLIDQLVATAPQTIIYLSCNPATQARDIKILRTKYHIDSVAAFNFFPRTPHIENLIVLSL